MNTDKPNTVQLTKHQTTVIKTSFCRPSGARPGLNFSQALRPGLTYSAPPALVHCLACSAYFLKWTVSQKTRIKRFSLSDVPINRSSDQPIIRSPDLSSPGFLHF